MITLKKWIGKVDEEKNCWRYTRFALRQTNRTEKEITPNRLDSCSDKRTLIEKWSWVNA